jgi:parallel beta-helix repeat protein
MALLSPLNAVWTLHFRISIALSIPLCCNGDSVASAAITLWERDTMNRIAAVLAGLSLAFVGTSASISATINVPGDYALIQDAIDVAADGDIIAIAAGTYYEHSLNPGGKAIYIGSASGNLDVTIDAQWGGRVFAFETNETAGTVIQNLVITGGQTNFNGGGIYCYYSNPTISNCTITGNEANYDGGGIYCWWSSPSISNCTISDNTAGWCGGGFTGDVNCISCGDSTAIISNSQFCGNEPKQICGSYTDAGGNTVADECPIPEGACCVGSSCSVLTEDDCVSKGGTYLGDSSCSGDPCYTPPTEGACCVTSGCDVMAEAMCENLGGTWLGEDASCDDCPASCMGDTDGNGVVNIEDLLNMLGSWGACP